MGTKKGMVRKTARRAYTKKAKSGSIASMAKRAGQFGKKKSGKYLNQDKCTSMAQSMRKTIEVVFWIVTIRQK